MIVHADGLKWVVDDQHGTGDILGPRHEESVQGEVLSRLPAGGVFVDIGAQVGHYTLRAAKTAARVIAIDANPAAIERLSDNLHLNEISNVTVIWCAAWDTQTSLVLDRPSPYLRDGSTRVREPAGGDGDVPAYPLDRLLRDEPRIDLVKLDVEGADLHALRGMAMTLRRHRPVLFIEDHSIYGYYQRADLDKLAGELGYVLSHGGTYGCAPYLLGTPV